MVVVVGLMKIMKPYVFALIDLIPHIAMTVRQRQRMTAFSYFYYLFDSFTKFLQITHSSLQNEENMKVSSSLLGWFGFSSHALWLI